MQGEGGVDSGAGLQFMTRGDIRGLRWGAGSLGIERRNIIGEINQGWRRVIESLSECTVGHGEAS